MLAYQLQNLQTTDLSSSGNSINQAEIVFNSTFAVGETFIGVDGMISANFCNTLKLGVANTATSAYSSSTSGKVSLTNPLHPYVIPKHVSQANMTKMAAGCTQLGVPMTTNDVNSAITNDTLYQNGECEDNGDCTIGETDEGNAGVVVLNYGNRFK